MGLLNIVSLYHLPGFKQTVLQFCLCLRGIYQRSKQKLMEGELSPKLVAGNACSLDARNHTGRREMEGRQKPSLPSGVSFAWGKWSDLASQSCLSPVTHTLNNHEMVAYLLFASYLKGC